MATSAFGKNKGELALLGGNYTHVQALKSFKSLTSAIHLTEKATAARRGR